MSYIINSEFNNMIIPREEKFERQNEVVLQISSVEDEGFWFHLKKYFREYTEVTGIQGLRYVMEKRSKIERTVWGLLVLFSLTGCMYMIYEIIYKYENSPVVVTFATEETPLYQIPLPAVTICPQMKYSIHKFNYSQVMFQLKNEEEVDETELKKFLYLNQICWETENATNLSNDTVDADDFFKTLFQLQIERDLMLLWTTYENQLLTINDAFVPVITSEGICYSFNILEPQDLFTDQVFQFEYEEYYSDAPQQSKNMFDLETGYSRTVGRNAYPRRALMSGTDFGLAVGVQQYVEQLDLFCSVLEGFKVLIHNPWDSPDTSTQRISLSMGNYVYIALEPELVKTTESVRKFAPKKRNCFLKDEKSLLHFRRYTQANCILECEINYILSQCGCVPFYAPRFKETPICGLSNNISDCIIDAKENLTLKEVDSKIAGDSYCDCKPECTSLRYNVETSHEKAHLEERFRLHPDYNFLSVDELNAHRAELYIYFKNEQFKTLERNELYGTSDLISNLGGLLGLFTGFSLISLAEIIYFCSLRLFYNERLYGTWSGPPN